MTEAGQHKKINILITGGAGFLGDRLVTEAMGPDSPLPAGKIRVIDIADPPADLDGRVEYIKGDILNRETLEKACAGMDMVIHTAAIVDWGVRSEREVMEVNVEGTKRVIEACLEQKVPYLVHTSSLDAVYNGEPLVDINETHPYPENHITTYCKSKCLSEKLVVEAHGNGLSTCVLRPSDIYGEKDPYHMESLIGMAKGGFYIRLGNGKALSQHVYVGNMAHALLMAGSGLANGNTALGGNVYFITDAPPSNFFRFFDQVVRGAGYRIWPRDLWLPRGLAYFLATLTEFSAWLIRPVKKINPGFSRFAVVYTCTDYTFTSEKARRDFDFEPRYSKDEALERTIAFYKKAE